MLKFITSLPYWLPARAMRYEDEGAIMLVTFGTLGAAMTVGGLAFGPFGVASGAALAMSGWD